MMLSKVCITKGINLRTEDTTATTTTTTEEDLTEVEEESEATKESMQQVTGEMLSVAVLDSGATSTVCGKTRFDCNEETLSDED